MARNFNKKLTIDELAVKIWQAWSDNENFGRYGDGNKTTLADVTKNPHIIEDYKCGIDYKFLTPTVLKDLKKVEFDCENMDAHKEFGNSVNNNSSNYVGLHTLDNGLSFLGVNAGGDWESPLFFIVYHDGAKLRGYIPTDGNPWNTDEKSAYGNNEETDEANAVKRGWKSVEHSDFDFDKIGADIKERIVYEPNSHANESEPKPVVKRKRQEPVQGSFRPMLTEVIIII